jgi:hypothetical protein
MEGDKSIFDKMVNYIKFTMYPNHRKKNFNHPDLIGISKHIDEDGNEYLVHGWIFFDKKRGEKVLKITIAKRSEQESAMKMYKASKMATAKQEQEKENDPDDKMDFLPY